jgi:hypothetical protein
VVFVAGNRPDEDPAKGPTKALGIGQRAPNCDLVNGCLGRRGHRFRPRRQRRSWHHRRGRPLASGHGWRRLDEGRAGEEGGCDGRVLADSASGGGWSSGRSTSNRVAGFVMNDGAMVEDGRTV